MTASQPSRWPDFTSFYSFKGHKNAAEPGLVAWQQYTQKGRGSGGAQAPCHVLTSKILPPDRYRPRPKAVSCGWNSVCVKRARPIVLHAAPCSVWRLSAVPVYSVPQLFPPASGWWRCLSHGWLLGTSQTEPTAPQTSGWELSLQPHQGPRGQTA